MVKTSLVDGRGGSAANVASASGHVRNSWTKRSRSSGGVAIGLLGVVVAAGALLPVGYLLLRASELGIGRSWEIATSSRSLELLRNTATLSVAVTASSILIAVPLAWLTVRSDIPAKRVWVVLTALPLAIPSYVGGFAFVAALGPRGMAQGWLEPFGVDELPAIYGFGGAWLVLTLFSYPYILLTVRAALTKLDPELEEVSRSLGNGPAKTFFRVILPQLRPSITAGGLLVALYALSDFGAVSLMRYDSFTRGIFLQYQASLDRSRAAVLGLVLVVLAVLVVALEARSRGGEQYHRLHAGGTRRVAVQHLGRAKWPAFFMCSLLVAIAVGLPAYVIGYWFQRGVEAGEPMGDVIDFAYNSLRAAAGGTVLAVLAAIPVSVLSVRFPGLRSRLIEAACWAGHALPGVVVALALVFFGARTAPLLYQTMGMLAFAYAVLFLPQAIGAMRSSLLQLNPSLEEASLLLGHGPMRTLWSVVLPQIRPGVMASGALVFLTAMKELPATLLLAPTGFTSLATRVWSTTSEGQFGRAAAPALALIVLSSIPTTLLVLREREGTGMS